jgi:CBS-domain-containing membrane protein
MSVLELCDREIAAVPLEASVADAIHKMLDHHVGAVAVVDDDFRVAGIFTERDAAQCPQPHGPKDHMRARTHDHPVEMATRGAGAARRLPSWNGTRHL